LPVESSKEATPVIVAEEPRPSITSNTPSNTGRRKVTLSLTDLANGKPKSQPAEDQQQSSATSVLKEDKLVEIENLKHAWNEFAEQRKSQVGEYHLLKQDFDFNENLITIHLSNPVEEPLLQSMKAPLTEFLRERLGNSRLSITSQVTTIQTQKIAYTNKEKFDKLAEKNPILNELKKRLDLDPDF